MEQWSARGTRQPDQQPRASRVHWQFFGRLVRESFPAAHYCNTQRRYHGVGKCTWVNGSVYVCALPSVYLCNTLSRYEGAWVRGSPNGVGVYAPTRLCVIVTRLFIPFRQPPSPPPLQFTCALRSQRCSLFPSSYVTADGSRIQGTFENGLAHGTGSRRYQNSDEYGALPPFFHSHNPVEFVIVTRRYNGEFQGGFRHGTGTMT